MRYRHVGGRGGRGPGVGGQGGRGAGGQGSRGAGGQNLKINSEGISDCVH